MGPHNRFWVFGTAILPVSIAVNSRFNQHLINILLNGLIILTLI